MTFNAILRSEYRGSLHNISASLPADTSFITVPFVALQPILLATSTQSTSLPIKKHWTNHKGEKGGATCPKVQAQYIATTDYPSASWSSIGFRRISLLRPYKMGRRRAFSRSKWKGRDAERRKGKGVRPATAEAVRATAKSTLYSEMSQTPQLKNP